MAVLRNPDIIDVGPDDYQYDLPFSTQGLERVLVENEARASAGVQFTAVDDLEEDVPESGISEESERDNLVYRVERRDAVKLPPGLEEDGTLPRAIAPEETAVAATFSAECADEYPSVHHLAPGNPLMDDLIDVLPTTADSPERLSEIEEVKPDFVHPPLRAWGRNGTLATITEIGEISEKVPASGLSEWLDEFIENRTLSHPG